MSSRKQTIMIMAGDKNEPVETRAYTFATRETFDTTEAAHKWGNDNLGEDKAKLVVGVKGCKAARHVTKVVNDDIPF